MLETGCPLVAGAFPRMRVRSPRLYGGHGRTGATGAHGRYRPPPYTGQSPRRRPLRMSERFELVSPYAPAGDQPQAIDKLVAGFDAGLARQVLLGVTG